MRPSVAQEPPHMIKTLSLSALFFLVLGLLFAAYASVPVPL
ncbi:hypothetical protein [Devosia sp. DBB001]|nr:hypothetical protein [Devosia sp. DBB001]